MYGQPGQGSPQQAPDMLPSTGLQRQLGSLQSQYQGMGDPRALGAQQDTGKSNQSFGATSLDALAKKMAQSYGLATGGGPMFDAQGNALVTPQQLAAGSGGTENMSTASMKLQMISDAVAKQQNLEQQNKATAALQTGLGLVQNRGRGSLATLQEGTYQALAQQYANQEYESADFSFWIAEDRLRREEDMARKARKASKWGAIGGLIGGVAGMAFGAPGVGAAIGSGLGSSASGW
jgi:hypothetical protein